MLRSGAPKIGRRGGEMHISKKEAAGRSKAQSREGSSSAAGAKSGAARVPETSEPETSGLKKVRCVTSECGTSSGNSGSESPNPFSEAELKARYGRKLRYAGSKSPEVKRVHSIAENKKGSAIRSIVAEGIWLNRLVLKYHLRIECLLCCPEEIRTAEAERMFRDLAESAEHICVISKRTLESLEESGSSAGILTVCEFVKCDFSDIRLGDSSLVLVLDGLEIPGNLGTLVRSADGVDAAGVIVTNKKTRLTHPKYIRSSQGSCFRIPVVETEASDAIAWLARNGFRLILADTDSSVMYYEPSYEGRVAIVLGSERYGISASYYASECYDADEGSARCERVGIPMFGDCDSLNVGIAGTVFLYEASLKQKGLLKR